MNKCCKNNWVNDASGFVYCEKCGDETFFTELKISAKEIISAGGYNETDSDLAVPLNDVKMIEYLYQKELEDLKKKIKEALK